MSISQFLSKPHLLDSNIKVDEILFPSFKTICIICLLEMVQGHSKGKWKSRNRQLFLTDAGKCGYGNAISS